jgi:hypothetical protein
LLDAVSDVENGKLPRGVEVFCQQANTLSQLAGVIIAEIYLSVAGASNELMCKHREKQQF